MLDLSAVEASADSPELAEYKAKVEKTAREYAKRHNWCSVINQVLRDLDINAERKVPITVTTSLGVDLRHTTMLSALVGKTEEEQKAAIAAEIGSLQVSAGLSASSIPFTVDMIVDLSNEVTRQRASGGWIENEEVPGVGTWLYATSEGRVEHFFERHFVDGTNIRRGEDIRRDWDRIATALCRTDSYTLRRTSERGESRHCVKCEERLARMS